MNKSSNSIHYGTVYKLLTVNQCPETFHMALLYSISVSSCRALEQIQPAVPAEIIGSYNMISSNYVSSCSQSTSLAAVFIDDIIVQDFEVNSTLCPLDNKFEKGFGCVESFLFQNVMSCI